MLRRARRGSASRSRAGAARPSASDVTVAGSMLSGAGSCCLAAGAPAWSTDRAPKDLEPRAVRKLKRDGAAGGAFLINAGRGPLQVDADIVTALDEGTLAGARSMSFTQSRCRGKPLWTHPKVTITPHNAGDISPRVFAPHVIAQIERFERGLPLEIRGRPHARILRGMRPMIARVVAVLLHCRSRQRRSSSGRRNSRSRPTTAIRCRIYQLDATDGAGRRARRSTRVGRRAMSRSINSTISTVRSAARPRRTSTS